MNKVPEINPTSSSQEASSLRQQNIQSQKAKLSEHIYQAIVAEEDFEMGCESGFNEVAIKRKFNSFDELNKRKLKAEKKEKILEEDIGIEEIEKAEDAAAKFEKENFEHDKKYLLLLRQNIKKEDKAKDILKIVLKFYSDPTLIDDALNFIIKTSTGNLKKEAIIAKETYVAQNKREILSGKNIQTEAHDFAKKELGSPTDLRNLYRNITGQELNFYELFNSLVDKYNYEKLKDALAFLFHSLGSDLKAKGPSIPRAQLKKLLEDTKDLQAVLNVFRFFNARMKMIKSQFLKYDLKFPPIISFEILTKLYMKLVENKYISPEKVLNLAQYLGISNDLLAQIIIYTQMRDATRNTSLKMYRSNKHRQDVLDSIMEAIEELDEMIEEKEEENEN